MRGANYTNDLRACGNSRTLSRVNSLKILLSRDQIRQRVQEMGEQITRDYAGQSIILVGVLKGATIFLSDLARSTDLDATFDFIACSSYGNKALNSGEVRLVKDLDQSMAGKNILLVEDILDTGLTLNYLKGLLLGHGPRSLKIVTLLDKPSRRIQPVAVDYIGFTIPDEFVVGYGLDYAERYRNLPDICVLPKEML